MTTRTYNREPLDSSLITTAGWQGNKFWMDGIPDTGKRFDWKRCYVGVHGMDVTLDYEDIRAVVDMDTNVIVGQVGAEHPRIQYDMLLDHFRLMLADAGIDWRKGQAKYTYGNDGGTLAIDFRHPDLNTTSKEVQNHIRVKMSVVAKCLTGWIVRNVVLVCFNGMVVDYGSDELKMRQSKNFDPRRLFDASMVGKAIDNAHRTVEKWEVLKGIPLIRSQYEELLKDKLEFGDKQVVAYGNLFDTYSHFMRTPGTAWVGHNVFTHYSSHMDQFRRSDPRRALQNQFEREEKAVKLIEDYEDAVFSMVA